MHLPSAQKTDSYISLHASSGSVGISCILSRQRCCLCTLSTQLSLIPQCQYLPSRGGCGFEEFHWSTKKNRYRTTKAATRKQERSIVENGGTPSSTQLTWNSLSRDESKMSPTGTQHLSSGPYLFKSTRYCRPPT